MLPSLFPVFANSIQVSFCLVAVLATPMAYKNELPIKVDSKGMIQNSAEISAFR
jgi:hypothetical protein